MDADATDFTEFHGKNRNKKAPLRGFREIRVPKRGQPRLKKHSLRAASWNCRCSYDLANWSSGKVSLPLDIVCEKLYHTDSAQLSKFSQIARLDRNSRNLV